jgi:hypothetical protein
MSLYIGSCRLDMQAGSIPAGITMKTTVWKLAFIQCVASE